MVQTHKVYRVTRRGDPSSLSLVDEPMPADVRPHEVLVRVKAVSINYREAAILDGTYPFTFKDNVVLGSDMAGEVVKIGEAVIDLKQGDRVTANFDAQQIYGPALTGTRGLGGAEDGVLQQYRIFPALALLRLPAHLSFEEGACLCCTHLTAWNALFGVSRLMPGQSVLFQGTGGVCLAGLTLADAAGAMTIVTSGSDEKLEGAKKLGATHTINYKKRPDWEKKVMEITGQRGVDYIFDSVGISELEKCFNCIAPGGIIESFGFLGGTYPKEVPNLALLAIRKNATLRGVRIGSRQQFEELLQFLDVRQLRPQIDRIFAFNELKAAFDYREHQKNIGKVVVIVD